MFEYEAKILRVVDGDTVKAEIDLGFHMSVRETFRLKGINTPENSTQIGRDVTVMMKHMLEGQTVIMKTYKTDKYGRWLAEVFQNGTNINQWLVDTGNAIVYME